MSELNDAFALVGDAERREELSTRLPQVSWAFNHELPPEPTDLEKLSLVIDLNLDEAYPRAALYAPYDHLTIIGCAVKRSLFDQLKRMEVAATFVGLNALPTFINRTGWELSSLIEGNKQHVSDILRLWEVAPIWVPDGVGMLSAKSLFLIINEAYYMLEEGMATKEDIDLAMKLGTAYPEGPFAWCQQIGPRHVYEVLKNLYEATGQNRYVPANSLKQAAWKGPKG